MTTRQRRRTQVPVIGPFSVPTAPVPSAFGATGVTPFSTEVVPLTPFEAANRGLPPQAVEATVRPPPPFTGAANVARPFREWAARAAADPFAAPPVVQAVRGYWEGSDPNLATTTSRAREFGRQVMQAGSLERIQGQIRGEEGKLAQVLAPFGAFPGVGLTDPLEAATRLAGPAARVGASQVRGAAERAAEAAAPVARRLATGETGALGLDDFERFWRTASKEERASLASMAQLDASVAQKPLSRLTAQQRKDLLDLDSGDLNEAVGGGAAKKLTGSERERLSALLGRQRILRLGRGEAPAAVQAQPPVPLIDAEQQAARAASRTQEAAGQTRLPGTAREPLEHPSELDDFVPGSAGHNAKPYAVSRMGIGRLYHETSPDMAMSIAFGSMDKIGLNVSPFRHLALGQRGKGVLLEFFNTDQIEVRALRTKPGNAFLEKQLGAPSEMEILSAPFEGKDMVSAMILKPDVILSPIVRRRLQVMEARGWVKTQLSDGSIRYQAANVPASREAVAQGQTVLPATPPVAPAVQAAPTPPVAAGPPPAAALPSPSAAPLGGGALTTSPGWTPPPPAAKALLGGAGNAPPPRPPPMAVPPGTAPPRLGRPPAGALPPPPPRGPGFQQLTGPTISPKPFLGDLQTVDDVVATITDPNALRTLANAPGARSVSRIFNPRAVANDVVDQALVTREQLRFEGRNKAQIGLSFVQENGSLEQVFGKLDDTGRFATGALKGVAPNDLFTDPTLVKFRGILTPEQRQWAAAIRQMSGEIGDLLKRNGIKVTERQFQGYGEWVGRKVVGKFDQNGDLIEHAFVGAGPARPGGKLGLEQARVFATQDEAIKDGFRYMPDDEALYHNIIDAYNRIADKQVVDWLLAAPVGIVPRTAAGRAQVRQAARLPTRLGVKPHFDEAVVHAPAFFGKVLTGPTAQADAAKLNRAFGGTGGIQALTAINKVQAVSRMLKLGADESLWLIQLQLMAAAHPQKFGRAFVMAQRSFFDPTVHSKFIVDHADTINRHPNLILSQRGSEFTEAVSKGGLLQKGVLRPIGKLFEPFARIVNAGLDYSGVLIAESLEPLAKNAADLAKIDDYLNHMRGLADTRRLGVGAVTRQLETFTQLAPRYNRGAGALVLDMMQGKGNLRGALARKAMAKFAVGSTALAVSIVMAKGLAEGKSPGEIEQDIINTINPASPTFLGTRIGKQVVGLGGKTTSVVRMLGNMVEAGIEGDLTFNYKDPNFLRNPLVQWVRGNVLSSPIVSNAIDFLVGSNYIGEPVNPSGFTRQGMLEITRELGADFVPLALEGYLTERGEVLDRGVGVAASEIGLRSYPESPFEDVRRLAEERFGKPYDDLTSAERNRLFDDPKAEQALGELRERAVRAGDIQARIEQKVVTALDEKRSLPVIREHLQEYLRNRFEAKRAREPQVKALLLEWEKEREELEPYWGAADHLVPDNLVNEWQAYKDLKLAGQKTVFLNRHPLLRKAAVLEPNLRLVLRRKDKRIDSLLVKWYGYAPTPRSPEGGIPASTPQAFPTAPARNPVPAGAFQGTFR